MLFSTHMYMTEISVVDLNSHYVMNMVKQPLYLTKGFGSFSTK